MIIGVGIGFVLEFCAVFGVAAVAVGFVFGAEALPGAFFAGGVESYPSFLELVDQADCFEEAGFYFLLVALEPLDDC